ncbi:MAG: nuclear pore complex subunit [Marinilabiliales bacterium]|nr:MAG: nuclear pore complex subunit [Marinilabiliales bacterium]
MLWKKLNFNLFNIYKSHMEPLIIAATDESPGVNLDKSLGKFLMFGKSFPEEVRRFFDPVLLWLEEYSKNANDETVFEIRLEYYNSATSTMLLDIFYLLEKIIEYQNKKVTIIWNYLEEDDDMLETGKEYSEMIKIPFEFKTIEDY